MTRQGVAVNAPLAETAALLHDLDKALPRGHKLRKLGHGAGGAEWLRSNDNEELAIAVANHPVGILAAAATYEEFAQRVGLEGCIVALADKRALQDTVSLDARFDRWYRRYPGSEMLQQGHARARDLERDICARAGIAPNEVQRLAWVDEAFEQAKRAA